jgi:hypothetical protein
MGMIMIICCVPHSHREQPHIKRYNAHFSADGSLATKGHTSSPDMRSSSKLESSHTAAHWVGPTGSSMRNKVSFVVIGHSRVNNVELGSS